MVAAQEPTPSSTPATAGPYFLFCNVCRWNSKEVNMTFEKPTSLACKFHDDGIHNKYLLTWYDLHSAATKN